jgi:hypothetical protein
MMTYKSAATVNPSADGLTKGFHIRNADYITVRYLFRAANPTVRNPLAATTGSGIHLRRGEGKRVLRTGARGWVLWAGGKGDSGFRILDEGEEKQKAIRDSRFRI